MVTVIAPRERPVGSGTVRRLLPVRSHRQIGPFTYADLIGPEVFAPGSGLDVDAHPHIGLATITYLFEGAIVHRDSTGAVQRIEPGDVNWMTAGGGVCHTERTPHDLRDPSTTLWGLQTWVALPDATEQGPPDFQHVGAADLPHFSAGDAEVSLVVGNGFGERSPVRVASPLVLAEVVLPGGGEAVIPHDHAELAVLVARGHVGLDGAQVDEGHLGVLDTGARASTVITASADARLMLLGGASVGRRLIWWNFVASNQTLIDEAKRRWRDQQFPLVPGDHDRWFPLPEG